jgi:diaminopimelate epimerase
VLHFTKMDGAGNDFVMIDNRNGNVRLRPEQIVWICDRHRGVGADGILLLEKAKDGADFRMRYYNRDGGEAEMCGNGARCFARFAHKAAGAREKLTFQTPAGLIGAELHDEFVTLRMSEPRDLRLSIELALNGKTELVHFINTGVPHAVLPVQKVGDVDVRSRGQKIRHHKMFSPKGANVNFMEKRGSRKIAIRTYERGVEGETLACGTGVVASALIFAAIEKVGGPISVIVRSGSELTVDFKSERDQFHEVRLTGPAEFVFEGTIDL